MIENAHPAIIDKRTFKRVQRKLEERRRPKGRTRSGDYLLSGMVICGNSFGQDALHASYADLRAPHGRDIPIEIQTVRLATDDEIDLWQSHKRMLGEEAVSQLKAGNRGPRIATAKRRRASVCICTIACGTGKGAARMIVLRNRNIERDFLERTTNKMLGTVLHELAHMVFFGKTNLH